jgi:DNA-binding SARP family transcriptional activator
VIGVDLLGPAVVTVHGQPVRLGAARHRALVSLLALRANQPVPTSTIVDVLWEGSPPAGALATLRGYVAEVRRILEPGRTRHAPAEVLVTAGGGYTLRLEAWATDAARLEEAVRRAADGLELLGDPWRPGVADHDRDAVLAVVDTLSAAEGCWRGEPLPDLGCHPDIEVERDRVRVLQLQAQVLRVTALVALRRHTAALTELERLCRTHPWHEHLWALRSLALAGCGRQVEALGHLRQLRGDLADQLGIDPDPEISRLETDLVRQHVARAPVVPIDHARLRLSVPSRGHALPRVARRVH